MGVRFCDSVCECMCVPVSLSLSLSLCRFAWVRACDCACVRACVCVCVCVCVCECVCECVFERGRKKGEAYAVATLCISLNGTTNKQKISLRLVPVGLGLVGLGRVGFGQVDPSLLSDLKSTGGAFSLPSTRSLCNSHRSHSNRTVLPSPPLISATQVLSRTAPPITPPLSPHAHPFPPQHLRLLATYSNIALSVSALGSCIAVVRTRWLRVF